MAEVYGSDVVIEALAGLGIDHVAFNPGASFRGLHESLVHLAQQHPVLCLSEPVAVAVAHGFAKTTGRPMAVFLHNLVGLQSGSMAIFNAWVDQVPMMVIGGSGPADRTHRRPWIDWIHTARPQAMAVRDIVKWDDEPTSLPAVVESLATAHHVTTSAPAGPAYVSVDALLQEARVDDDAPVLPSAARPATVTAPTADLEAVAAALVNAERPLLIADHLGRSRAAYDGLIELAELLQAPVIDLQGRHSFPNTHPLDGTPSQRKLLGDADVVVALDVRDLDHAICDVDPATREVRPLVAPGARLVDVGLGGFLRRGFLEARGPGGVPHEAVTADTAVAVPQLADLVSMQLDGGGRRHAWHQPTATTTGGRVRSGHGPIDDTLLAGAVYDAVQVGPWRLAHGLLRGAVRRTWRLDRWNAHIGASGGAGLGYGVGASIGAALGAEDDELTVALQPDGDLLYTASGWWTAANQRLAMLTVVVNNRTYLQDRMHQTVMSETRGRPVAHAAVGIDLENPTIDYTALAEAQGVEAFGPVRDAADLEPVLHRAASTARQERRPVVVDVHVGRPS